MIAEEDGLRLAVICANGDVFSVNEESADPGTTGASAVASLKIPVLVVMNGDATGPGLELALAADLRICVSTARSGFPGWPAAFSQLTAAHNGCPDLWDRPGPTTCYLRGAFWMPLKRYPSD